MVVVHILTQRCKLSRVTRCRRCAQQTAWRQPLQPTPWRQPASWYLCGEDILQRTEMQPQEPIVRGALLAAISDAAACPDHVQSYQYSALS